MDARLIYNEITGQYETDIGVGARDPFVTTGQTQTLTNKTLTAPAITGALTIGAGATITSPSIVGPAITGTSTIGNGCTITTPVLSGAVTGTYTLAGTPTVTAPTITTPTISGALGCMTCLETLFTQVAGNKVHTATFTIPAGATITDIWVTNSVVWNSDTTAVLKVGLVDDDCFFTGIDLKTVPAAGKSMNLAWPGASNGGASVPEIDAGAGNTQLGAANGFFYNAAQQALTAIVTDTNVAGTNGRTRVAVLYALPSAVIAPVVP